MQNKDKREKWKLAIITILLIMALIFLYLGRTESGMVCFAIGCILFVGALWEINRINKK